MEVFFCSTEVLDGHFICFSDEFSALLVVTACSYSFSYRERSGYFYFAATEVFLWAAEGLDGRSTCFSDEYSALLVAAAYSYSSSYRERSGYFYLLKA